MGCQLHSWNPHIVVCRISEKRLAQVASFSAVKTQPQLRTKITITSSYQQDPITPTTSVTQLPKPDICVVEFKTLGACKLGISRYPDFEYNAEGGKGTGTDTGITNTEFDDETAVEFDVKTLYIPPLTTATTKFLGLPLPPFLKIDIVPLLFKGTINQQSGKVFAFIVTALDCLFD